MIQPQELRIGNYIEYNGEIIKLDGSLLCCYIQNELDYPFNEVPLTEEILLKCGFEKDENTYYHELFMFNNGVLRVIADNYRTTGKDVRIEFLHQLQNLYFALTGGELTFKN